MCVCIYNTHSDTTLLDHIPMTICSIRLKELNWKKLMRGPTQISCFFFSVSFNQPTRAIDFVNHRFEITWLIHFCIYNAIRNRSYNSLKSIKNNETNDVKNTCVFHQDFAWIPLLCGSHRHEYCFHRDLHTSSN